MSRALSSFGKAGFAERVKGNNDVDKLLDRVKNMELTKYKNEFNGRLPPVVNRLLNKDSKEYKRRRSRAYANEEKPKKKPVKRVVIKEPVTLESKSNEMPGSAHYTPNFESILTASPAYTINDKVDSQPIIQGLGTNMLSEMVSKWGTNLRTVQFIKLKETSLDFAPLPESTVHDTKGVSFPHDGHSERDSFITGEVTPGPSAYNVKRTSLKKPVRKFDEQTSRPVDNDPLIKPIRDIRADIDRTQKRQPRQLPFDKQSSREKKAKQEDPIWTEIEEEQKKMLSKMDSKRQKEKPKTARKEPFALQTRNRDERGPFSHIMRKEVDPKYEYDVDKSWKYLERPKTAFNISQPAQKTDRMVYRKSEAPDIFYNDVQRQWNETQKSFGSPPIFGNTHDRYDAYYYMPHPCGQEHQMTESEIEEEYMKENQQPPKRRKTPKPQPLKRIIDTPNHMQSALSVSYAEKRFKPIFGNL